MPCWADTFVDPRHMARRGLFISKETSLELTKVRVEDLLRKYTVPFACDTPSVHAILIVELDTQFAVLDLIALASL